MTAAEAGTRGSWPGPWHAALHLLVGGGVALLALALALLVTVATLLTLVLVGGLLLAVLTPAVRWLAGQERRRTGRWTGHSVPELYAPTAGTLVTRVETVLRDPATWRDLLWLWVVVPVGLLGLLLCWVPYVAPWWARREAALSRRLLTPTARSVRRAAEIDATSAAPTDPAARDGHGLVGMRERVTLLGGTLASGPLPGGGFEVVAELPLTAELLTAERSTRMDR